MRIFLGVFSIIMSTVLLSGCILSFSPSSEEITVEVGDALTFEITIFGSSAEISWSLDGEAISGATSTEYTYTPTEADIGDHTLTVTESLQSGRTNTRTWSIHVHDASAFAVSVAESVSTYDEGDIVDNHVFDYTIYINFTESTAQLSSGPVQDITTDGVTLLTVGDTSVIVSQNSYGISIDSTIEASVKYDLYGELAGTLTLESTGIYQLYLDGVDISGSAGPALDLESDQKVFIVTASGTVNTMNDESTRDGMTMKAAFYGKGPMVFSGEGALTVSGNYKHGIFSKDYIRVRGGELDVAVSARDAVRSVNGFIFDDGVLTINGTGTATDDESKGIKVEGEESADGVGKGYIVINGGYITVTSVGKAITAGWDIDDDAETVETTDDPDPYVEINNGIIRITTTGSPYEYADGTSCSPEGIEGKSDLTINSGYLTINTTDDCLNAGNLLLIDGGYLYCKSSENDAIDSNGSLVISGGVVVAIGANSPEGPFDCDSNTFAITGGTVVGIGGTTSRLSDQYCTQNVVVLGSISSGLTMGLKSNNDTTAFAFTIPQSYETMVISSPDIITGNSYTIYSRGEASADQIFWGLYLGDLSYTNGRAGKTFTVSSSITKIGGVYF